MDGAAFAGDTFGIGCQFPDTGEPGGKAGKADMARRPARPRDGHYSIEFD